MLKLSPGNEAWWRIDVPDRNDDGELVMKPVRFRLRIYTRAEIKARAMDKVRTATTALGEAMRKLTTARTTEDVAAASVEVDAAIEVMSSADQTEAADLAARIVGWNPADITDDSGPVAFTADLRDALLGDEARYNALRRGLQEASQGARAKNSLPGPAGSPADTQAGAVNNSGTVKSDIQA